MTPLGKSLIASAAIAIVVAGTLMLRPRPAPVARAQLTPAQLAEVQPPKAADPKPPAPPAASVQTSSSNPVDGQPDDPEFEDGNGS